MSELDTLIRQQAMYYKRKYGITVEEYEDMFHKQEGLCRICGVSFTNGKGFVDHDHKTNRVRGLLCCKCNTGLSYFNDDPERLKAAAQYLIFEARQRIEGLDSWL